MPMAKKMVVIFVTELLKVFLIYTKYDCKEQTYQISNLFWKMREVSILSDYIVSDISILPIFIRAIDF